MIQFKGLKALDARRKRIVEDICAKNLPKVRRSMKNMTDLIVHVKSHEKDGARAKFSIHLKAVAPTRLFTSSKATDWAIARATNKAFVDVLSRIKKGLKSDNQRPKRTNKVKARELRLGL